MEFDGSSIDKGSQDSMEFSRNSAANHHRRGVFRRITIFSGECWIRKLLVKFCGGRKTGKQPVSLDRSSIGGGVNGGDNVANPGMGSNTGSNSGGHEGSGAAAVMVGATHMSEMGGSGSGSSHGGHGGGGGSGYAGGDGSGGC
uniref:glycine-rich protein DOT1-like n=1 Tax=Erigeron canadensis TaxID=72917 RepID=UPI001CB9A23E|nr:glycine-rich protein DOT1-like [Erigeron canadensis]